MITTWFDFTVVGAVILGLFVVIVAACLGLERMIHKARQAAGWLWAATRRGVAEQWGHDDPYETREHRRIRQQVARMVDAHDFDLWLNGLVVAEQRRRLIEENPEAWDSSTWLRPHDGDGGEGGTR